MLLAIMGAVIASCCRTSKRMPAKASPNAGYPAGSYNAQARRPSLGLEHCSCACLPCWLGRKASCWRVAAKTGLHNACMLEHALSTAQCLQAYAASCDQHRIKSPPARAYTSPLLQAYPASYDQQAAYQQQQGGYAQQPAFQQQYAGPQGQWHDDTLPAYNGGYPQGIEYGGHAPQQQYYPR